MRLITLSIISGGLAIAYMTGKFWTYDRCCESEWSDTVKLFYILLDVIKDCAVIFLILNYLLQ